MEGAGLSNLRKRHLNRALRLQSNPPQAYKLGEGFSRTVTKGRDGSKCHTKTQKERKTRRQKERQRDAWSHRDGRMPDGLRKQTLKHREAVRSDGLVKPAYLAVYGQGRLVELCLPGIPPLHDVGTRGVCEGMSADSKRRLMTVLQSIRRDAPLPIMMTLTFPEEVTVTPSEAKACRRAFAKRIAREHEDFCALWRLEAHPEMSTRLGRVCPHFHLLIWGCWFDLEWVSATWTSVVWSVLEIDDCLSGKDGRLVREKHRAAATNTERIKKWAGVAYCVKQYLGKDEEFPLGKAGRVWGWDCAAKLPISEVTKIVLGPLETARVQRGIRAWMDEKGIRSEFVLRAVFHERPTALAARLRKWKIPEIDERKI